MSIMRIPSRALLMVSPFLGRFSQGGPGIQRRRPAQVARLSFVMRTATMHRATVVPDHQVTGLPGVAVDEARLRRMRNEIQQQQAPVGDRPTGDVRGMTG